MEQGNKRLSAEEKSRELEEKNMLQINGWVRYS